MAIDIDSETIVPLFEIGKHCPGPPQAFPSDCVSLGS